MAELVRNVNDGGYLDLKDRCARLEIFADWVLRTAVNPQHEPQLALRRIAEEARAVVRSNPTS